MRSTLDKSVIEFIYDLELHLGLRRASGDSPFFSTCLTILLLYKLNQSQTLNVRGSQRLGRMV